MAITTIKSAPVRAKTSRPHRRSMLVVVATAATVVSSHGSAAEWRFTPSVAVSETYSDNIFLAPSGLERSDFVTQIAPGFTLTANGPRLKINAAYALQGTTYVRNSSSSGFSNILNGTVNAELIQDLLYVDARASIGQQNISAFGAQSTNNTNINGNRADVRTYSLSPYLRHNFGSKAYSELRYTHESVGTNSNLLAVTNTDGLALSLNSGEAFQKISWGLRASARKDHYKNQPDVDRDSYAGSVRYFLTPHFSLTATAGHEKDTYISVSDKPNGAFYNGGFVWKPTSRTELSATAGHRYFGPTYTLLANHRARNAVFNVSYTEDITTSQQQFASPQAISTSAFLDQLYSAQIPDPVTRQQVIDTLIRQTGLGSTLTNPLNSLTNTYFLQKNLQASVAINGVRNTVVFNAFDTRRTAQSPQLTTTAATNSPFAALNDSNKQLGASALWNLKFSPHTSGVANLNVTRTTSLSAARVDNYKTLRLALTERFQKKVSGTVELRHSQQNSDVLGGDIRENAITASLLMQF